MVKQLFLCLVPVFCCSAATWHVNVSASAGGDGSVRHPFRAIQRAADRVNPGDTVEIAPGVYFETVRLKRFGTEKRPVTFRADKIRKNRVIVSGADPAIRRGERKWRLFDGKSRTYCLDWPSRPPGRVLYSGTDLFPYQSLQALTTFQARPGVPGPRHGFCQSGGKLYVRLRSDGKYGPSDPNRHQMAVSPAAMPYEDVENPDSQSYNFGLLGKAGQNLHVMIDGITFETPGCTAVYVSGNHAVVRNCRFVGCRAGGVIGRKVNFPIPGMKDVSSDITIEFCEWHSFPIFDDVKELIADVKSGRVNLEPKNRRFHYWVHKNRINGAAHSYETGIAKRVGRNWTIKNCYIHDCFDGLANLNYGEHTVFENNLFERCIDNAIETEDHAGNCYIRRNRFIDVWQGISLQPLNGKPWPGPIYVYQNLFSRTPENLFWGGSGGTFKLGVPVRQWEFPHLKTALAEVDKKRIELPGLLIFNNTIIDPPIRLVCELGAATQKLDNVFFYNNLAIAANIRHPQSAPGEGGVFYYHYINNRFGWTTAKPSELPALRDQVKSSLEKLLPGWKSNSFIPAKFEPAVPVPGAPEQFKYIGALQTPDQRIADRVGVQEDEP